MADAYYIDLEAISLLDYETELEGTELLPSRMILKEDMHARFEILDRHGTHNLKDVLTILKTPEKIKAFAQLSGLPEEYLAILKREIASSQPKPVALADFPGIKKVTIEKLAQLGIKDTRQLFAFVQSENDRKELSKKTEIPDEEILELTKLSDVVRIRWVGANFARLLVDSPYDTLEKVSGADYEKVYAALVKINQEKRYFKGMFGANDMKMCVAAARNVPRVIHY